MSISALLASHARDLSDPSPEQIALLASHWELLLRWNRKINLTRVTDPSEAVLRHYGESIFLGNHVAEGKIADVGSGAGFPGIPIAVMRPACSLDLVESTLKKAAFLQEASRNLPNARVLAKRAQDVAPHYDWVISRAVDPDEILALHLAPQAALLVSRSDGERLIANGSIYPLPWDSGRVVLLRST